jgi:hypothetical protein
VSARLSVDPELLRAYGVAAASHAADLQSVAGRLAALGPDAAQLGPVGARFVAALARAADGEAGTVTRLGDLLGAAHHAAGATAQAYRDADTGAGARLIGGT